MVAAKGHKYVMKRKRNPQRTDEQVDALCVELLEYAVSARSIHLAPFCYEHGYSLAWLSNYAARNEKVGLTLKQAKEILSAKIVNTSFYGEGNPTVGMKYLPVYDEEFREVLKWEASLLKDEVREGSKAALLEYLERLKKPSTND